MCILLSKYPLNKEENALNNNPTDFVYGKSQDNIYHKLHQVDVSPITNAFLSKPSPFLIPKAKESRAVLLSFPNQPTIPFDFTHKNAYKRASASVKPLILTKIPLPKTKYSDETAAQSFTVVGEFSGLLHSTDSKSENGQSLKFNYSQVEPNEQILFLLFMMFYISRKVITFKSKGLFNDIPSYFKISLAGLFILIIIFNTFVMPYMH